MEKITLLLDALKEAHKANRIKVYIREFVIFVLALGVFFTSLPLQAKIIIAILGCLLGVFGIMMEVKKRDVLRYCEEEYLNNPEKVVDYLNKRKTNFSDVFDFTNERLIYMEIIRVLKSLKDYPDFAQIGPWNLAFNKGRTKSIYQEWEIKPTKAIIQFQENSEKVPQSVRDLLNGLGVNYLEVFDIWNRSFKSQSNSLELMYPVAGIITNDSQVLIHGLHNKSYQLDGAIIKPYERTIGNESVVMFHVIINI